MSKVIAIANKKGGVGKTAMSINLAQDIADTGKRVLLMDFDPQDNLAIALASDIRKSEDYKTGNSPDNVLRMFECALKPEPHKLTENLHLIGSHKKLGNASQENIFNVADALDLIKDEYDFVLIDCPPSAGTLQHAALAVCDRLLIVSQPQKLSANAVNELIRTAMQVKKRLNKSLEIMGVVQNLVKSQATKDQTRWLTDAKTKHGSLVFDNMCYDTVRVREAMEEGKSLQQFSSKAAKHFGFTDFFNEFLARV